MNKFLAYQDNPEESAMTVIIDMTLLRLGDYPFDPMIAGLSSLGI